MAKKDKCETFGDMLSEQILRATNDKEDRFSTHTSILGDMIMNLASVMTGSIYLNLGDECGLPEAMRIFAGTDGFENIFLESALHGQLSMCLTKILKSPVSFGENDEHMNDLMNIEWILNKWNECATEVRMEHGDDNNG